MASHSSVYLLKYKKFFWNSVRKVDTAAFPESGVWLGKNKEEELRSKWTEFFFLFSAVTLIMWAFSLLIQARISHLVKSFLPVLLGQRARVVVHVQFLNLNTETRSRTPVWLACLSFCCTATAHRNGWNKSGPVLNWDVIIRKLYVSQWLWFYLA